ncbi:MAG: hypothetical protein IJ007_03670 [Oscillospiraceae bacterium]|nr:hypothetical protein [Oscillospiraceae bacterium]
MKKTLIILLTILTLTACAQETEKVTTTETTTESISVTEEITSAEIAAEQINVTNSDLPIKSEYNDYITLNTSISPDTEKNLTDIQRKHIEVILNETDSTDKDIMSVLSLKKETADKEHAPVFQADITAVYELDGKTYAVRSYPVMGSSVMYDIWCTEGNTAEYVGDFTASEYVWQYPLKNGQPVMVSYEFYSRGHDYSKTPLIAADVYVIENGKLTECHPDDGKQFFWLCEFESTDKSDQNRLFILDKLEEGYSIAPEDVTELVQNGSFKQELMWSEGKLTAEKSTAVTTAEIAENKKAVLDKEHDPFGVTAVYEGTAFDFNKDGIDDHIYAFSLYNQFQLTVIDGADNTYLFDETIMSAFDESSCRIEIYTNKENSYAVKAVGRNIYSAESELTETIQIFCEKENLLLEAVYDKETEQFLHAYEKYTYDEYTAKQNEILDGYTFNCVMEWSEVKKTL